MADAARHDLDVLEFDAVRTLLLERLSTPLGRTAVAGLGPLPDGEAVAEALEVAGEIAVRLERDDPPPLTGAVEVRSWLGPFFAGEHQVATRDLADLKRVLRTASLCAGWLGRDPSCPALVRVGSAMPPLRDLVGELEAVIDDRGEVLDSASGKLREVRRSIEAAELAVQGAVRQFLSREGVRRFLQNPEPSWRHGRPVFQVRTEHRARVPGVLHDRSQSGATVFVEPDGVVDAANLLSDARAAEHREIQVVLTHVGCGLRRMQAEVEGAIEAVAVLDLAQAKARLVVEDGFRAVPAVDGAPLRLCGARHPLLQRTLKPAVALVPLDLGLGDPHRVLVITGPNTGGKTVALKTVGLLTLMALSGVPVPAGEGTSFPWLEAVLADIGDDQGISQNLSTFSSHVTRIARCLGRAGPRSLLLLDELGAGTDPEEGGALGHAVLEELVGSGALAVVTTHLGRLKAFAYQQDGAENGSMAFDGRTLLPLYRLDVGIPGNSHALDIAGRVGMPEEVVGRARELLGERDGRLEEVIDQVQRTRRQAEEDRRRTEEDRRKARLHSRDLEQKLKEAERMEAWLEEEASSVVDEELRQAREALEKPLRVLANAPGVHGELARELLEKVSRILGGTSVHRRRMAFLGTLKKGSAVFLPRWGRRGTVRKIDRIRETVTVEYGRMKVDVPFEDVSWLEPLEGERG